VTAQSTDLGIGESGIATFGVGKNAGRSIITSRRLNGHRLVPPPGLISADDGSKHSLVALSPAKRRDPGSVEDPSPPVLVRS
jgi:hypothetical protein